jgi:3-dehydroquinate dehydratase/shikimate dehydrogenase
MLVAVIAAKNYKSADKKIRQALSYPIDMLELRLDYFSRINIGEIKKLKSSFSISMIFTIRKKSQGGLFKGTEKERLKIIRDLLILEPEYFDLEYDIADSLIKVIYQNYPHVKLICSYHDFKKTPKDLDKILISMVKKEFSVYKIAVFANATLDSLRMLNFVRKHKNVCGLCMGALGAPTRILSPIVDNYLNYASIDSNQKTAPGQLCLRELFDIYRYQTLNKKTNVYALLGDPVQQSIGHIFHNKVFQKLKQNAVYIKLQVNKEELPGFFQEVAELPFKGFSITMPLKESIVSFLDLLSDDGKKINAVNTILNIKNKLVGCNTDGLGVLNSIEKITAVKDKKIVVLGAGGTANAVVYEALKRGAKVIVLNRTVSRAKKIAQVFGCKAYGMNYVKKIKKEGYDILINATSVGMMKQANASLLPAEAIVAGKVILDMVYKPKPTKLLKIAKAKKCICISGKEVFITQAVEQDFLWFHLFL